MESELQLEVGATSLTVKVPLWYAGKLCGPCGSIQEMDSLWYPRLLIDVYQIGSAYFDE